MKRKDFLRKMRNRRFGEVQQREPERRRAVDWRTLRFDLPAEGESPHGEQTPAGEIALQPTGIRLQTGHACWVRGYRVWKTEEGQPKAEFQYRPNEDGDPAPPGAEALAAGSVWEPEA